MSASLRVLYVEDNKKLRESIEHYLRRIFDYVDTAYDGEEGLQKYQDNPCDIIISDILMPHMNGLEMTEKIKKLNPEQEVIIISAYSETEYFAEAIKLGVDAYIVKPIDFEQMNATLYKCVSKLTRFQENKIYKEHLEEEVEKRTASVIALEEEKIENFQKTLESFVSMIEDRDTYTAGHSVRVATYSRMIAQEMGLSSEECDLVYRAGILHDIGKVVTPDIILLKPGQLSTQEYKLIQNHVTESYKVLSKIPMYQELANIIICHHERYDGKGYPYGKKGAEIPLLAQIMIVADAFDAMTTNRIYKGRKSTADALTELRALSKKQFHPEVVEAAVKTLSYIEISESINQLPFTEIEHERFAYFYRDHVTQAFNAEYLTFIINWNNFRPKYFYINVLCLHNFTHYNEVYGWNEGDKFLCELVDYLSEHYPLSLIFRVHGDDFILLSEETLDINMKPLEKLKLFKNSSVTLSKLEIDLREYNAFSFEMLEKMI